MMKETQILLFIEYKPQDHGVVCVSLAPFPKQAGTRARVQKGGGRLKL